MENLKMKKKWFTESQLFVILKEGETGVMMVPDLCRQHSVRQSTYSWMVEYHYERTQESLNDLPAKIYEQIKKRKLY